MNRRTRLGLAAALTAAAIVLPLIIVHFIPTDSPEPHVFEAAVQEELGRSANDQLAYYDVQANSGSYPAADLVVAIDRAYTRGISPEDVTRNASYWFQGSTMTEDVFYGEQYLFFGKPQVYVRQVKTGVLWPDQVTELGVLYLSPLTTLAAPVQLPLLARSEEATGAVVLVLAARLILVLALAVIIIRQARKKESVLLPILVYAIIAILLTVLILGDLY